MHLTTQLQHLAVALGLPLHVMSTSRPATPGPYPNMWSWILVILMWMGISLAGTADEVGVSWRRVDDGRGDRFTRVCWEGPVAVGVGSRGLLRTSTDGKVWTLRNPGVQATLRGVAWSGSHYLVVGSGGTILRSPDGTDWQRIDAPPNRDFWGVTWTGTQFIALDSSYFLSTSADGVTWNRFQVSIPYNGYGIEHFDGATYLMNQFGIARSTDLVTWTQVLSLSNNNLPAGIRKLNGRLFSVGPGRFPRSSTDGITWTSPTLTGPSSQPSQALSDIAWNGSIYLAVCGDSFNLVWRSLDGLAWTAENAAAGNATYVRWINGEFVAGDGARNLQTSLDGRDWTKTGEHTQGNAAVWTGSRFIKVGNYGYIATSSDFETWTTRDSGIHTHLQNVVWTGSFALATAADGVVMKSSDGLVWTKVAGTTFTGSVRLAWTGTLVHAFSGSGTDTSTDGTSWTRISTLPRFFYDVKWLRDRFIAIGSSGALESSVDGVAWTPGTSGTTGPLYAAAASPDEFMVGGQGGILRASTDGVTWSPRTVPVSGMTVSSLEYRFGRWFLASNKGIHHSVDGISWTAVPGLQTVPTVVDQIKLVWSGSELVCTALDARTSDGIHWQQREIFTSPDFNAVAKGVAGDYVAVGEAGMIHYSPDGYSWQAVESPTGNSLVAVTARPGRWVAVGSGGVIVSSPDGVDWTLRGSGTTTNLSDVASNGQRFAAVGQAGVLLVSPDGLTWSVQTTGTTVDIPNIESVGPGFKAFASSGRMIQSPDGIAWTLSTADLIADVTWNGSYYVAVGHNGWSYASNPDGLEWTRHPTNTFFLTGICWTGTLHVACGTNGTILTSPDGITWTPRTSGVTSWVQAVVWNGTQLVAVGHAGTLLYSADGITWNKGTMSGGVFDYEDVAWADGRYVAVGKNGGSATSTNGVAWQSTTGIFGTSLTVDRVGTRFLAGAAGGLYSSTPTSTQWVSASNGSFTSSIYDLEANGNKILAATTAGVYSLTESPPGKWITEVLVHASPMLDNLVRNGSEIVATGSLGTIVLSRNGISWKNVRGGRDAAFTSTATNGIDFVGVGNKRPLVSPDGTAWNSPAMPAGSPGFSLTEMIWTGSRFLGLGPGMVFRTPTDGTTWTSIGSTALSPPDASGVAGDDELLVAVGADGWIAVSDGSGDGSSDYQVWMTAQGVPAATGAPLQDANSDGISNLIAYIFGIPANGTLSSGQRAALPAVSFDPVDGSPVLTFELRESYRPGATYHVEASPDLQPDGWQVLQNYSAGWGSEPDQATITESPLPGGGVRITVSDFPEPDGEERCFFRLRARLP